MAIDRRTVLSGLAALSLSAAVPRLYSWQKPGLGLRINAERLRKRLE